MTLPAIPEPPDDLTYVVTLERSASRFILFIIYIFTKELVRKEIKKNKECIDGNVIYLREIKSIKIYKYLKFKMSMDDSGQEDCTVYIEELKSDNPSLKLNAASKISLIGSVLGIFNLMKDMPVLKISSYLT